MERVYAYISQLGHKYTSEGKIYTYVHIAKLDTDQEITRYFFYYDNYKEFYDDYKNKTILPFYAFYVNLCNEYYYRIDWDDVYLLKYERQHLHEIARTNDKNGNERPLCFRNYVIYAYYEPDVDINQFRKNFESSAVQDILSIIENYEKIHFFIPFKKETRKLLKYNNAEEYIKK